MPAACLPTTATFPRAQDYSSGAASNSHNIDCRPTGAGSVFAVNQIANSPRSTWRDCSVPFLYSFGAWLKIAVGKPFVRDHYGRGTLIAAGLSGFLTTSLGIALAFFPAQQTTSLFSYEIWMFGSTLFFVGLATFFSFTAGAKRPANLRA
jgi:hypothetical protein